MSVYPHETARLPLDGFSGHSVFEVKKVKQSLYRLGQALRVPGS
jgi:hypothetical protein